LKKLKFPSAQTILIIIAGLVAILTFLVPAGKYDTLIYDSSSNMFLRTSQDNVETLVASQVTLEELDIKIPLEKFTSGDIYKAINIPKTYKTLEANPQGILAFI